MEILIIKIYLIKFYLLDNLTQIYERMVDTFFIHKLTIYFTLQIIFWFVFFYFIEIKN